MVVVAVNADSGDGVIAHLPQMRRARGLREEMIHAPHPTIDHVEPAPQKRHDRGKISGTRAFYFISWNMAGAGGMS